MTIRIGGEETMASFKIYYRYKCTKCLSIFKPPNDPECLEGGWAPERLRVLGKPDPQRMWVCPCCNRVLLDEEVKESKLMRYER